MGGIHEPVRDHPPKAYSSEGTRVIHGVSPQFTLIFVCPALLGSRGSLKETSKS